ncbi:dTMP kinase [Actinosynnema sp. NPDC047251]|uniref:Thymidylate kinase n=1 Tax=Saccharothrix espanaensis (strain ATCC 51144 / DSM 44229 / JCM 9112 / NBRC 15066 / NRRL 15764) TaxID=1179773 RepID=K0KE55_SACES|nr:dTMP kinase [Saccharothrix espanaensis]CCH34828.1 dTMP kinase [Saccharothrix espanaensis DSM 44229]
MGKLVVIEGLDGAGKRTLAKALTDALAVQGRKVATGAFPRYDDDIHAELVRDALHGRLGDLTDSVHGMSVLYALDRRGAADRIRADLLDYDVVLLDRYIASNAAYGAARLRQHADGEFVDWLRALEVDRFGLPIPDLQLLLRVPSAVAQSRAAHRETSEQRERDVYESDDDLQSRCGAVYDELAAAHWLSPWEVLDGTVDLRMDGLLDRYFTR